MYCFDTNVIIDIFRGDKKLWQKIEKIKSNFVISITPITLCELYKGTYLSTKPLEKVEDINNFVSSFSFLDFTEEACKEFGRQYSKLRKKGKMTSEFDLIIGSIVKVNNLILVTRNKKHFENIDVKIEVW